MDPCCVCGALVTPRLEETHGACQCGDSMASCACDSHRQRVGQGAASPGAVTVSWFAESAFRIPEQSFRNGFSGVRPLRVPRGWSCRKQEALWGRALHSPLVLGRHGASRGGRRASRREARYRHGFSSFRAQHRRGGRATASTPSQGRKRCLRSLLYTLRAVMPRICPALD